MAFVYSPMYPGLLFDSAERYAADMAAAPQAAAVPDGADAANAADVIADMGWALALIPESMGGLGGSLADVAGLIEGLAVHGNPLPVIERCVIAPLLLLAGGAADRSGNPWLLGLVDSTLRIAPLVERNGPGRGMITATTVDGGLRLDGRVRGVEAGDTASHWIVPVRLDGQGGDAGCGLVVVDAADVIRDGDGWRTMDGRASADRLLASVVVPADRLIARGGEAAAAIARAADAALALIGVDSAAVLGTVVVQTVAYLSGRVQFGVPLSSFQALRHQLVDVYIAHESARGMVTRLLADAGADGSVERRRARLNKLAIGESSRRAAETVIQLHGGMGMSEETPAARLAQRLLANEFRHGDRLSHSAGLTLRPLAAVG